MVPLVSGPAAAAAEAADQVEPGRRVVENTLVQFATPGLRLGLGIVLAAALSRYLGVAGFGEYALVLAFVATFSGIFNEWGLSTVCLREVARRPADRHQLIASAATLQLVVALASYLLMLTALLLAHYPVVVDQAIAIYGLTMLMAPLDILALPFQADLRLTRLLPPALLGTGLNFLLSLGVILLHGSVRALVLVALIALLAQYAWVSRLSLGLLGPLGTPRLSEWRSFASEAWPLGVMTVLTTALQQGPILGLSLWSVAAVGLFNAANKIPAQLFVLPLAMRVTTFPLLSRSWVIERPRFIKQVRRLIDVTFMIAIPATLAGIGIASPLVTALYGRAFSSAAPSFALLMVAFGLMAVAIVIGEALIAAGFQRVNLAILCASVPFLGLLLVILVPRVGITGAAIAVAGTDVLVLAAVLIAGHRLLGAVTSGFVLARAGLAATLGGVILVLIMPRSLFAAAATAGCASLAILAALQWTTVRELLSLLLPGQRPAR